MPKIKCSKCAYFKKSACGKQCSRYAVSVDEDTICVDCDEVNCLDDLK